MINFELLREYLQLEFLECETRFSLDLERVADDWVFICMLLGNDYLPKLPNFDLRSGALSVIHDAYKEALSRMSGKKISHKNTAFCVLKTKHIIKTNC